MKFAALADMAAGVTAGVADEILLHGPSELIMPPPVAVGSDEEAHELQVFWAFESARRCSFAPVRLLCLEDVYLAPEGLVFLPSGECLIETIYPWERSNVDTRFPRLASSSDWLDAERSAAPEVAEAVHLREPGEAGYFHWINSVLPRIAVLQRFYRLRQLPLAVDLGKPFAVQSAGMLGLSSSQVLDGGKGYRCKKLWVFTPAVIQGDHFTRPVFWTSEIRRTFLGRDLSNAGRKLYLSRADASVRAVVNEAELIALVRQYGFQPVTIGSMPFADQVGLFGSCDMLLSAHGAGLSNAIFMRTGRVVEILPRTRPWPTFRALAARAGLSYGAFISSIGRGSGAAVAEGNEGIDIDLKRFERFLRVLVT
jgi:hypothetical protein